MSHIRTTPIQPDPDPTAIAALDAALDALVSGSATPESPPDTCTRPAATAISAAPTLLDGADPWVDHGTRFDPAIHQTASRLHSAHHATEPDPAFATSLRRALLSPPVAPAAAPPRPAPIPARAGSRLGVVPFTPAYPARTNRANRVWPAVELAAIVLLFAVFLGTLSGGDTLLPRLLDLAGLRKDHAGNVPPPTSPMLTVSDQTSFQSVGSPTANTSEPRCTVPPADLASLAATVNAGPICTTAPTPTPIPAPAGQPADPEIAAAVGATVTEWVACSNAGEEARALALFTFDALSRFFLFPSHITWDPDLNPGPATPRPASEQFVIRSIDTVGLLPDGRAVVDFTLAGVDDPDGRTLSIQYVLVDRGDRWLIDGVALLGEEAIPDRTATPASDRSTAITVPLPLSLRSDPSFSTAAVGEAAPGSVLTPAGSAALLDGIVWLPVSTSDLDPVRYLPASYITGAGLRIPGVALASTEDIGTPDPSECTIAPIPLSGVATHMGPSPTGQSERPDAVTYLASATDASGQSRLGVMRTAVITTVRETIACHNAGSYLQSVALNTPAFYQHTGASAYRPNVADTDLQSARPLSPDDRTEILDIGDVLSMNDGRAAVVMIIVSHDEPIQVTSVLYVLALRGDRWLIDDAVVIDSSTRPGAASAPTGVPTPSPSASMSSTPASAAPPDTSIEPIFPVGSTVAVRADIVVLRSLPRSNAEPIARLGPCACGMTVFGPMADSGDALWLPVTDDATGVSGYVSLDLVLPPEGRQMGSFRIGQTVVTTSPVRLRGVPEPSATATEPHPAGITLEIEAVKISAGHTWIMVPNPMNGGIAWIPHDILVAATTVLPLGPTPAPATPAAATTARFDIGQPVVVTQPGVGLYPTAGFAEQPRLTLGPDDELTVTGIPALGTGTLVQHWWPVATANGTPGYVMDIDLTALESERASTATPTPTIGAITRPYNGNFIAGEVVAVTTDGVNLRTSPGYDDDNVIAQLEEGSWVRVTGPAASEDDATWWPVEVVASGTTGFVLADFLESTDDGVGVLVEVATVVADDFEGTETARIPAAPTPTPSTTDAVGGRAVAAGIDATIAPTPPATSGCTAPPRFAQSIQAALADLPPDPSPNPPLDALSGGVPADPVTRRAITAHFDGFSACVVAGDPLRVYAFVSEFLLSELLGGVSPASFPPGPAVVPSLDRPAPIGPEPFTILTGDIRVLPDGRIRARVFLHGQGLPPEGVPAEYLLIPDGERWRIDHVLPLGPLDPFQSQVAPGALPIPGSAVTVIPDATLLQAAPSFTAETLAILPAATQLVATGPVQKGDGVTWWAVDDPISGRSGHVVALYLAPDQLSISFDILDPAVSPVCAPTPSAQTAGTASGAGSGTGTASFGVACGP